MGESVKLKDGSEVEIRPMRDDDVERSHAFFLALPHEDRQYLRRDVTRREVVEERIRMMATHGVKRLVAVAGGVIVAEGAIEPGGEGWKRGMAELRLIVAPAYQRKGLGVQMARHLYLLANAEKVSEIVVKLMRPQRAARSIFGRLGFREETLLPGYVTDLDGAKQDLIIMRCDLETLWSGYQDYLDESDWMERE